MGKLRTLLHLGDKKKKSTDKPDPTPTTRPSSGWEMPDGAGVLMPTFFGPGAAPVFLVSAAYRNPFEPAERFLFDDRDWTASFKNNTKTLCGYPQDGGPFRIDELARYARDFQGRHAYQNPVADHPPPGDVTHGADYKLLLGPHTDPKEKEPGGFNEQYTIWNPSPTKAIPPPLCEKLAQIFQMGTDKDDRYAKRTFQLRVEPGGRLYTVGRSDLINPFPGAYGGWWRVQDPPAPQVLSPDLLVEIIHTFNRIVGTIPVEDRGQSNFNLRIGGQGQKYYVDRLEGRKKKEEKK